MHSVFIEDIQAYMYVFVHTYICTHTNICITFKYINGGNNIKD